MTTIQSLVLLTGIVLIGLVVMEKYRNDIGTLI